ncbi:MAG: UDP-N-acetylmuramoyl-L-alanine--D-glutamate ligase [Acidaminococcaceae bacterium]
MPEKKYILVYGAGISGCGVAEVLANHGERVVLYNDEPKAITPQLEELLVRQGGAYLCTALPPTLLAQVGQLVLSPGIAFDCPLAVSLRTHGIETVSEVEIASRLYSGQMIAITGTNGKTTTTMLVGAMLACLPVKTAVGGNIGLALSKEIGGLDATSWLAAELSSFQLEGVQTLKPKIAVILNITPDHLERHGTMANYSAAKKKIFSQQTAEDITILNADDPLVAACATETRGRVCFISRKQILPEGIYLQAGEFVLAWQGETTAICRVEELKIFGAHNEENVLAAIGCAFFAGVTKAAIKKVLCTFEGVEHRLEYVRTVAGVKYYNDSKATNPDSTMKALESFSGQVILLAGGHDKMTELEPLMELVRAKTEVLILLGEAKERFGAAAKAGGVTNVQMVNSFEEAVALAYKLATAPQVVLLSPACSSYDMFDNFPQRGCYFKKLVNQLGE